MGRIKGIKKMNNIDFGQVLIRLSHIGPLLKAGAFEHAIDNMIEHVILLEPSESFTNESAIKESLALNFGIKFTVDEIKSSLDRLKRNNMVIRTGTSITLEPDRKLNLQKQIKEREELEKKVALSWKAKLMSLNRTLTDSDCDILWQEQKRYLALVFQRHGAECISLFSRNTTTYNDVLSKTLKDILEQIISKLPPSLHEIAKSEFPKIFDSDDTDRCEYLMQLLDTTFVLFSLGIDDKSAIYIRESLIDIILFLDTNFLMGLLNLHINPLNEVSKQVLQLIRDNKFQIKLYYSIETAREFQKQIQIAEGYLCGRQWSQDLSMAAVESRSVTGILAAYHELNTKQNIDPEQFLSKYKHFDTLLKDFGIDLYPDSFKNIQGDKATKEEVKEYSSFLFSWRFNIKPESSLWHDIFNKHIIHSLRKEAQTFWRAKYFFLTCDYTLIVYDRECRKKINSQDVAFCLLPNHLLQMLRPFITRTEDYDRAFIEAFALPQFRTVGSNRANLCSKILSALSIYKDIKKETAIRILTNNILLDQLKDIDEKTDEFTQIIENEFVKEAGRAIEDAQKAKKELEEVLKDKKLIEDEIKQKEFQFNGEKKRFLDEMLETRQNYDKKIDELKIQVQKLLDERQRDKEARRRFKFLIWTVIISIGLWMNKFWLPWVKFQKHERWLGLTFLINLFTLVIIGTILKKQKLSTAAIIGIIAIEVSIIIGFIALFYK